MLAYQFRRSVEAIIKAISGAGFGLDADMVDGQHASAFTDTAHNHSGGVNGGYIPASGFASLPMCRVYHNANQDVQHNTWTALNLNTEHFDTDTIHDTGVNITRLTCKTEGKYLIAGCWFMAANGTGVREIAIRLNGSVYIAAHLMPADGSLGNAASIATLFGLQVNDYVELMAYQDCGGPLTIFSYGNYSPEFGMAWLGP